MGVFSVKIDRPYFDAWLRRTGKQLAASGRLTQIATSLSSSEGGSLENWRATLRDLLAGNSIPSLDLLTQIDGLLAGPQRKRLDDDEQTLLPFGA